MVKGPEQRRINKGDWTLGIIQRLWGSVSASGRSTYKMNGAATVENTFRCFASPEGALGPLPEVTTEQTIDLDIQTFPSDLVAGTNTITSDYINITDLFVLSPLARLPDTAPNSVTTGPLIFIGITWSGTVGAGGDDTYAIVRRYERITPIGMTTPVQDIFLSRWTNVPTSNEAFPSIIFAEGRSSYSTSTPPPPVTSVEYGPKLVISVAGQNSLWDTPVVGVLSATDQVGFAGYFDDTSTRYSSDDSAGGLIGGSLWVYPETGTGVFPQTGLTPLDSGVGGALTQAQAFSSFMDMVCHQGRVVGIICTEPLFTDNSITVDISTPVVEARFVDGTISYTVYPDYLVHPAVPIVFPANPENTSGYGAIGSINASQLFLVKNQGGGVLINGSLDDPTVVQLPFIESTFLLNAHGINTPIGFVYASRNGIFVWAGGETTEHLSSNLEGHFWNDWSEVTAGDESHIWGITGRLAYWHPFVAVPNNYLYDIRTKAWWRLDTADALGTANTSMAFAYYDVDAATGILYMVPHHLSGSSTAAQRLLASMKPLSAPFSALNQLASTYSFQSQPLVETELELHEFVEIILIAQRLNTTGTITVGITLSGYREDGTAVTPSTTTITLAANTLINTYRAVVGSGASGSTFTAKSVQYRILTTATGGADVAPIIHDLDFITVAAFGDTTRISN